ncbi:hypothetical protein KY285_010988 [Solanum tuberosum]|nr:hypothetical protein KY284_011065 [Solanum tuberosum]KAH0735281.1 hypothetical protein KY285_010988 [Solanum tuberosum]
MAQTTEYQLLIAKENGTKAPKTITHVKWEPVDANTSKLNANGFVKKISRPGGLGGVVRNHMGHWVIGFTERTPLTNLVRAELQAL